MADELVHSNEQGIDIAETSLRISREFNPKLDIDNYSEQVSMYARRIRQLIGDSEDADREIEVLNRVLFYEARFTYDESAVGNPFVAPLEEFLESRKSTCLNLAILYLAVAQRAEIPLAGIVLPSHIIVQSLKNGKFIDPSVNGKYVDPNYYIQEYAIKLNAVKNGTYFRILTNKELSATLLASASNRYMTNGDYFKAFEYAQKSIMVNYECPVCWDAVMRSAQAVSIMTHDATSINAYDLAVYAKKRLGDIYSTDKEEMPIWKSWKNPKR